MIQTLRPCRGIPTLTAALLLVLSAGARSGEPASGKFFHIDEPEGPQWELLTALGWDSRYSTEGRDLLEGAGIASVTAELEAGNTLLGFWFGRGDRGDYEETNLYLAQAFDFAGGALILGGVFLHELEDGERGDDCEILVAWEGPEMLFGIEPFAEWYYSFEEGGAFAEVSLSRIFELSDTVHLIPELAYGHNFGFVPEGHRGANHLALGLHAHWHLRENLTLEAHLTQNWAIGSDPARFPEDDQLRDFLYGGAALVLIF